MWKIVGEILVGLGILFSLYKGGVISLETAILIGGLGGMFLLCFQELKYSSINPIKLAIVEIQSIFTNWDINLKYSLTEKGTSPTKPTEFGWKLIKESGIDKIIEQNKVLFLIAVSDKLKEIESITAYDVQEKARSVMIELKDKSIMKSVKDYAFENALDVETILRLGGLILRDEYLKEHSEISHK